jgi:hypothetical protein
LRRWTDRGSAVYLVIGGDRRRVGARAPGAGFEVTLIDPGDPRKGASFSNIDILRRTTEPLSSKDMLSFPKRFSRSAAR